MCVSSEVAFLMVVISLFIVIFQIIRLFQTLRETKEAEQRYRKSQQDLQRWEDEEKRYKSILKAFKERHAK